MAMIGRAKPLIDLSEEFTCNIYTTESCLVWVKGTKRVRLSMHYKEAVDLLFVGFTNIFHLTKLIFLKDFDPALVLDS